MAAVKSVERFEITLAASATQATDTMSKSQTAANCVPFVTKRVTTVPGSNGDWFELSVDCYISGNTVYVETGDATARVIEVEVTVVEFDPDYVTVHPGTWSWANWWDTSRVEAIGDTIVEANSFLVFNAKILDSGDYSAQACAARGYISSDSQVTFERNAHGSHDTSGHFYVIEADDGDFATEESTITVSSGNSSDTGTISEVVDADTLLIGSYETTHTADDNADASIMVYLSSTTEITVSRASTSDDVICTVYAIEFAGAEAVQRAQITGQGATALQDVTITGVTDAVAMPMTASGNGQFSNASFPGSGSADVADSLVGMTLTSTTNLRVQHDDSGGEADNDISWQVIEWVVAAGGSTHEGTGTAAGVGLASGSGAAAKAGAGTAAGVGLASGAAGVVRSGAATAAGVGLASAAGAATLPGAGTAAGVGLASASGVVTAGAVATAAGVGLASGAAVLELAGSGTAAGVGLASGAGTIGGVVEGAGTATGVGLAIGVASAELIGAGTATGVGLASGAGSLAGVVSGVGTAAGVGLASGVASTELAAVGTASGVAYAIGGGGVDLAAIGTATGVGLASASAVADRLSAGIGAGVGSATGAGALDLGGASTVAGIGLATGSGTMDYAGVGTAVGVGLAIGTGTVTGLGSDQLGAGVAAGVGLAIGAGLTFRVPPERVAYVDAESRTATVRPENRVVYVDAEDRSTEV